MDVCGGGLLGALFIFGSYFGHTGGVGDGLGVSAIPPRSQHFLRRLVRIKHTMATHAAAARERGEGAAAAEGEKRMCA